MNKKKPAKHRDKLTVITTHNNADFDGLASLLAAQKLYPGSVVVFPDAQDSNLRNFFMKSMIYLFNIEQIKNIDIDSVKTLVLVDTRQKSRIGKLAEAADRPGVKIHIYDHHPINPEDLHGDFEAWRITGATVTILTEILIQKNISITADEATLMCLGLYEDTGSFTFSSTTKEDFLAAAHLVESGANLNAVASLLAREISPEQITLLNDMIRTTVFHPVHGIEVAVCTLSTDYYFSDFSVLVHKLMKMENMDALIALGRMGDRVHVVGRSRIPEVNVGKIIRKMGGGGHGFAAAATIKDRTLIQLEAKVLSLLHKYVQPRQKAKDIMSSPAICAPSDVTIKKAADMLTQYNINALCVKGGQDGRELLGVISRQVLEKALHHHLDDVLVREYMTSEPFTVNPKADLSEIQKLVIEHKQRILPVMDNGNLVGVITRTDLLNLLISRTSRLPDSRGKQPLATSRRQTRKAGKMMADRLSPRILGVVKELGVVADQMGVNTFLVGGFVRDLVLSHKTDDIDVVVEGDGIAFARKFAKKLNARIHSHAEFGTAVVILPDKFKVDVASARFEYYQSPASLPVVSTSSIKLDLYRRDFTVNTMAIQINKEAFGILIDFFGAQRDIKAKSIRVLHNLSFVEDPTRVFRAIRFEQRFGFKIGKLTSGLIKNAVKMDFFRHLSGRRVFSELKQIMEEENPVLAVSRMDKYNLLPIIHPAIVFNLEMETLFESTKDVLNWHDLLFLDDSYMKWAVNFLALFHGCDTEQALGACERLEIAQRHRGLFLEQRKKGRYCLAKLDRGKKIANSEIYRILAPVPTEVLLHMMASAKNRESKRLISLYFTSLSSIRCLLSGKILKQMGIKPGPIYRKILDAVLEARLDNKVKTLEDEISMAKDMIKHAN